MPIVLPKAKVRKSKPSLFLSFSNTSFTLQFELEVTVTPKGATLKVDGEAVTLTDDGKYLSQEDFDKELKLKVELEGYDIKEVTHTIKSKKEDNVVTIDVSKKEVQRKKNHTHVLFLSIILTFTVHLQNHCNRF